MTDRFSRSEIKIILHADMVDVAHPAFYEPYQKAIRQLLADRDKLIDHIRAIDYCVFSHDSEFTGESLKTLIEEVGK